MFMAGKGGTIHFSQITGKQITVIINWPRIFKLLEKRMFCNVYFAIN
jgi:hypothetical protein